MAEKTDYIKNLKYLYDLRYLEVKRQAKNWKKVTEKCMTLD